MRRLAMMMAVAGLMLAGTGPALAGVGDITLTIKDLDGNDIAPGAHVKGDLWGVSQPKVGGNYTWHYMKKNAVAAGAGSSVTWTSAEVDAEVDLTNNNFWFMASAWGGSPWANSQVQSSAGLWACFIPYDATLAATNWDVNVITGGSFPGTPSCSGVSYSLDLGTTAFIDSWASVNITYEGCAHDCLPCIAAETKAYMVGEGYAFDETLLASNGLLRITNPGTGYDQTFSARSDGAGGYIQELETLGYGTTSYDDVNHIFDVQIDFAALGLNLGDTYFCKPGFEMELTPDYGAMDVTLSVSPGYVGHTLDPLTVLPVPEPGALGLLGVAMLGLRRRRRS